MRNELLSRLEDGEVREMANLEPKELGFWTAEYLAYGNFPRLGDHTGGPVTAYRVNYVLLSLEEYKGFFKLDNNTISSTKDEDNF